MRLAEGHGDQCVGGELFQCGLQDGLDEGGVHRDFADEERGDLSAVADVDGDVLERGGFLGGLLEGLKGLGAGIKLATGTGDETGGFYGVNLDALFAFRGVAELGLGFEPAGLAEHTDENLAVADFDRLVVDCAFAGLSSPPSV